MFLDLEYLCLNGSALNLAFLRRTELVSMAVPAFDIDGKLQSVLYFNKLR